MKKKLIYVAMMALLVTMFAGCQSNEQTENAPASGAESMEAPEMSTVLEPTAEPEPTEAPTPEPTATPEPTEPPADESSFDTSWASNDFEKLIPEPPFQNIGWECIYEDKNEYEIAAIDVAPYGGDEYYKEMEDYMRSLEQYGFVILEGEYDRFTAKSVDGKVLIYSHCAEGAATISITLLR